MAGDPSRRADRYECQRTLALMFLFALVFAFTVSGLVTRFGDQAPESANLIAGETRRIADKFKPLFTESVRVTGDGGITLYVTEQEPPLAFSDTVRLNKSIDLPAKYYVSESFYLNRLG